MNSTHGERVRDSHRGRGAEAPKCSSGAVICTAGADCSTIAHQKVAEDTREQPDAELPGRSSARAVNPSQIITLTFVYFSSPGTC